MDGTETVEIASLGESETARWTEWKPYRKYWVKVVTYAVVIFLCRKRCAVGKSMIYMSFLLDESIVCGIDFSNTLQGHTCF